MNRELEESYGVLPFRKERGKWRVLLILHLHGNHWGFPKGKSDEGENPQESATRELLEETGLSVSSFLTKKPLEEHYEFSRKGARVAKTVHYFPALVEGSLALQTNEVRAAKWATLEEALEQLTFDEAKKLCKEAFEQVQ
jgi:8-oxo-dGTP pyrophosphatase MutT (NUDIX family)